MSQILGAQSARRKLIVIALVIMVAAFIIHLLWPKRPPRQPVESRLFRGVTYIRQTPTRPRPLLIHAIVVQISTPGIDFLVTPGAPGQERETLARTTGAFLTEYGLQVAINANFFDPFWSRGLFDYYPHSGDPVDVRGLAIANGVTYSTDRPHLPSLCLEPGRVAIQTYGCPPGTTQAVTGAPLLLKAGKIQVTPTRPAGDNLAPRTAVGIDQTRQKLWLVVVDGRQTGYSEGVTLYELAQLMRSLGVETAVNLDGGGSSTMVISTATGAQLLNAPIHTRIPMRQRPVANHLGVYALPLEQE
jgi:hypothetical protein